jgi:hypothetical protein
MGPSVVIEEGFVVVQLFAEMLDVLEEPEID